MLVVCCELKYGIIIGRVPDEISFMLVSIKFVRGGGMTWEAVLANSIVCDKTCTYISDGRQLLLWVRDIKPGLRANRGWLRGVRPCGRLSIVLHSVRKD